MTMGMNGLKTYASNSVVLLRHCALYKLNLLANLLTYLMFMLSVYKLYYAVYGINTCKTVTTADK